MSREDYWGLLTLPFFRFRKRSFDFNGIRLPYFAHYYNAAHLNERSIEVSIAEHYLIGKKKVLEVGNVMNHYSRFPHDVVDKFEVAPGVTNSDICDFDTNARYDYIFSISTFEHIGWDERPKEKPEAFSRAVTNVKRLLAPGGTLLVTVPLGYNYWLDEEFRDNRLPFQNIYAFKKLNKLNQWRQVATDSVMYARYASPYLWANALLVCLHGAA